MLSPVKYEKKNKKIAMSMFPSKKYLRFLLAVTKTTETCVGTREIFIIRI